MQLYPALIFSPSKSRVRCNFGHFIPSWIVQQPEIREGWDPNYSVLEMPRRLGGPGTVMIPFAISPVGCLLVCGFQGHTMIWDHVTGTELYAFEEGSDVFSVAFSPDGGRVASSIGQEIRVRNFSKGTSVDLRHKDQFSPRVGFLAGSSNLLVSVSSMPFMVCVWNIDEERPVSISHLPEYTSMGHGCTVLSPLSDLVVTSWMSHATVWSITTEQEQTQLHHGGHVTAMSVSPDGTTVVSAAKSDDGMGMVRVWDVKTGDIWREFPHDLSIAHIARTEEWGGLVAIAIGDGTIELWQLETWHLVGCLYTDGPLGSLSFSPDGKLLVTTSLLRGILRLWDLTAEAERAAPNRPHQGSLCFVKNVPGNDGKAISLGRGEGALWDSTGTLMQTTREAVTDVAFSPDGGIIGIISSNGVQLWNNCMTQMLLVSDAAEQIQFSPGGGRIFLWTRPRLNFGARFKILSASTLEETALKVTAQPDLYRSIFSPNGRYLCWFSYYDAQDPLLCLLDFDSSKLLQSPIRIATKPEVRLEEDIVMRLLETGMGNEPAVLAVEASLGHRFFLASYPAGNAFATNLGGTDIVVKERTSKRRIRGLRIDDACTIKAIAISPTGKLAAATQMTDYPPSNSGVQPFEIHLWDLYSGAEIGKYSIKGPPPSTINNPLGGMSFSGDARYLDTQIGRLPVPRAATDQATGAEEDLSEIPASSLYQQENWLFQEFEKLLWLPPAYREVWPAFDGPRVVFGRRKGTVAVLKLDLEKTPIADQARARHTRRDDS